MKITKLGHCALLIETKGLRILTDPGAYSTAQNEVKNIDIILITHEHPDHLHIESLKTVLANNPSAEIISNADVGAVLDKENIKYSLVSDGQNTKIKNVLIEGFGKEHVYIYKTVKAVENTGYFIDRRFYYPGDSFHYPNKPVEILALPVAGPWMKISEAIEYAIKVNPRVCIPVHDGMFLPERGKLVHRVSASALPPLGIKFVPMVEGSVEDFG